MNRAWCSRFAKALFAWSLLLAMLLTSGCTDTQNVNAKLNPQRIPYEITITIDGAPGPFDSATGFMQYEVTNKDCVPETGGPMNAMRLAPHADPRITFQKVSDNVYRGIAYADYFQDEDYFGLGVCHWSLTAVVTNLRVNELSLIPFIFAKQIFAQQNASTFFLSSDYEDNAQKRNSTGFLQKSDYKPELQTQLFSVTLAAKITHCLTRTPTIITAIANPSHSVALPTKSSINTMTPSPAITARHINV
jgi:hypothetical protein